MGYFPTFAVNVSYLSSNISNKDIAGNKMQLGGN